MKFLKFACLGAVALALAGCGDSNAPANAKSEGAKAPAYEPMVAEGTVAALQYRKNESKAFAPMASAFAKCIWPVIFIRSRLCWRWLRRCPRRWRCGG